MSIYRLHPGLVLEHVGDEVLVLDPANGVVHRYRTAAEEAPVDIRGLVEVLVIGSGGHLPVSPQIFDRLLADGLVEPVSSRRRALGVVGSTATGVILGIGGLTAVESLVLPT